MIAVLSEDPESLGILQDAVPQGVTSNFSNACHKSCPTVEFVKLSIASHPGSYRMPNVEFDCELVAGTWSVVRVGEFFQW